MPAKASSRHCSRPVELDSQLPGNQIQGLAPEEAEHHLAFSGCSPELSLSQRPHPSLPRGNSGRPTASLRLPWRPSPHHLVIIPPFCHLPVLLGHVLSPNPVSKKTGSTSRSHHCVICIQKQTYPTAFPLGYEWRTPTCQASTGLPEKPVREPFPIVVGFKSGHGLSAPKKLLVNNGL